MRKSTNITKKFFNHYSGYTWSNEWYVMYRELFDQMPRGRRQIKHLLSVGGGDHVLFALAHLDSVERLTHVDISSYSMAGAMAKFAVILEGEFEDWYAFSFNSLPVSFVNKCLDKRGFTTIMNKLKDSLRDGRRGGDRADRMPNDLFYGLVNSEGSPLVENRKSFFLHRHNFDLIKERLSKIKRYDLVVHDIWSLKLDDEPDMALLSNAYHYGHQTHPKSDFLVRKDGFIIYTECDGGRWFANTPSWKRLCSARTGGWDGKLYRRTK